MSYDLSEKCEILIKFFNKAPIKKTFGMELSYNKKNQAIFHMPHQSTLEHAFKDTHGGVLATLLDNAGWFTLAVQYNTWIVTAELNINLLEPAKNEALIATGQIIRTGKSLAVAKMEIKSHSNRLIAIGSGNFSVTSIPLSKI